ncbi:MAG: ABC transporter ATP-binding protein [Anaerolineae bacterium]|nr:ABC transporter ATP-binding protein [Anaerolineae bacterium]MDQ7035833.1 ABC transporter ATP-binding protein [Anaerolineae bacterium]
MAYDIRLKNVVKVFSSGKHKGVVAVDNVSLDIEDGEFFALLGPSGCGKTTTLRMIAGFEQPTEGSILIRDEPMEHVPPFHRPVNTVFQDYALFPHMTVLQNIMFGLKMEGLSGDAAKQRAYEALELVRLPEVANRRPSQMSGGQQQRVALARALVKRPAVLLLDEPLGALDLKLRKQMQYELKSMQQQVGITFIYVTHDQEEAMTMADRIAVMSEGRVLQVGSPRDIYEQPQSRFVADFIGETNFISGTLESHDNGVGHVRLAQDTVVDVQMPKNFSLSSGAVTIPIRPERIGLLPNGNDSPFHNMEDITILTGHLLDSQYIGTDTRYTVKIPGDNEIVVRIQNVDYLETVDFEIGQEVQVFWSLKSTHVLDH